MTQSGLSLPALLRNVRTKFLTAGLTSSRESPHWVGFVRRNGMSRDCTGQRQCCRPSAANSPSFECEGNPTTLLSMVKIVEIKAATSKANRKASKPTQTLVLSSGNQTTKKPSKKSARSRASSPAGEVTSEYVKSLVDPFEHTGSRLGWGTMLPTSVQQAYIRGTATANADGSLVIAAFPTCTGMVGFWTGGAAVAGPTSVSNATDLTALQANFTEGRVISLGVRSYPIIAATSVPGIVYSGALPCPVWTNLAVGGSFTPDDFVTWPTSHMGIGREGACATGRPSDPKSFEFEPWVTAGFSSNYLDPQDDVPFSIPYNAYEALPASALVAYEVCVNFEGIAKIAHSSAPMGLGEKIGTTLADAWPSVERMWHAVKSILPPPGRQGSDTASSDALALRTGATSSIGKLLGYGQSALKYGKLAAGLLL